MNLDYLLSTAIFAMIFFIAVMALAYYFTAISCSALFWAAFILTSPLGVVAGDFLDKLIAIGDLALSRHSASTVLFVLIVACFFIFKQKPAQKSH